MFFENHNIPMAVCDVLCFQTQKAQLVQNSGRNYHAISFRKTADTVLSYGEKNFSLSDNSIVLVPARLSYTRNAKAEKMTVIHFRAEGLKLNDIQLFQPQNAQIYEKLFDEILRVWKNKEIGYQLKAGELFFQILFRITTEESMKKPSDNIANRAAMLIQKNAENACFSVSELAPALNISGSYLRRLFKEEFQMTLKEYLTLCRLEHAKTLLKTGYFTVSEVARRSGFENEKYFSTVFKKNCGTPPKIFSSNFTVFPRRKQ